MSAAIDSIVFTARAFTEIERDLQVALNFLIEYENLISQPELQESTSWRDEIQKKKQLVENSLMRAYSKVYAFRAVFADCPEYAQFESLSKWIFELNYGISLFRSVVHFKAAIQIVIDSIRTGLLLGKPDPMDWGLL